MRCFTNDTLAGLVGGNLTVEDYAALHWHAAECAACFRLVAELIRAGVELQSRSSSVQAAGGAAASVSATPATTVAAAAAAVTPREAWTPPPEFDQFQVVRLLGRGAMGMVYLCQDTRLVRPVAIKFLASDAPSARDDERLMAEARAIAQLRHPHVVAVHDVGRVGERTYLVSEFVDGQSLAELARPVPCEEVLRLGLELARGLAAAHLRGFTHRDIKPANIMLAADGQAKLLDFGLAVRGDDRARWAGTPRYMAPEVRAGGPASFRSDVYSLGLVLYELCCGDAARGPGAAAASAETVDVGAAGAAPAEAATPPGWPGPPAAPGSPEARPRASSGRRRGGSDGRPRSGSGGRHGAAVADRRLAAIGDRKLASIIDRCLRVDPAERPESGEALRLLLEARAREPEARWRALARWSRRLLAPTVAVVVGGLVLWVVLARRETNRAEAARSFAEAEREAEGRDPGRALPWILRTADLRGGLERESEAEYGRHFLLAREACERGVSWEVARHESEPTGLAFSPPARSPEACPGCWPQQQLLVSVTRQGGVKISDLRRGGPARALAPFHQGNIFSLAISPDGRWLATGGVDGRIGIWELPQGTLRRHFSTPDRSRVYAVAFSPDGRFFAAGGPSSLQNWDARSWERLFSVPFFVHVALEFHPRGRWLAAGGNERAAVLFDPVTGAARTVDGGRAAVTWALRFSGDGTQLAMGSRRRAGDEAMEVRVFDVEHLDRPLREFHVRERALNDFDATRDGKELILGVGSSVERWDARSGERINTIAMVESDGIYARLAKGDERVIFSGYDGTVGVAHRALRFVRRFRVPGSSAYSVGMSPDGRYLAATSNDGSVRLWSTRQCSVALLHSGSDSTLVRVVAVGEGVAAIAADGRAYAWSSIDAPPIPLGPVGPPGPPGPPPVSPVSPVPLVPPVPPGDERFAPESLCLRGSDEALLVTRAGEIRRFETRGWTPRATPSSWPRASRVACGPGGRVLVDGSPRGRAGRFLLDGDRVVPLGDGLARGTTLSWLDGARFVWIDDALRVSVGDVAGGRTPISLDLEVHGGVAIWREQLLVGTSGGRVRRWNPATNESGVLVTHHPGAVDAIAVHPRGHLLVTGSGDRRGTIRWVDADAARDIAYSNIVVDLALSDDGRRLFASTYSGQIYAYRLPPSDRRQFRAWIERTRPFELDDRGVPTPRVFPGLARAFAADDDDLDDDDGD